MLKQKRNFKNVCLFVQQSKTRIKTEYAALQNYQQKQLPLLLEVDKSQLYVSPSICVNDCCFELFKDFIDHEHEIN